MVWIIPKASHGQIAKKNRRPALRSFQPYYSILRPPSSSHGPTMTSNTEICFTESPSPRQTSLSPASLSPTSSTAAQLPHSPPPSPVLSRMSGLPNDEVDAVMNGGNGTALHDVVLSPVMNMRDLSTLPIIPSQDPTSSLSQELTLREPNERLGQGPITKEDEQKSMRRRKSSFGRWNPTLTLENKGSVARDHLASERTYLAYVRTSLTISSTGVGGRSSQVICVVLP